MKQLLSLLTIKAREVRHVLTASKASRKDMPLGRVLKTEEWITLGVSGGILFINLFFYSQGVSLKDALFWILYYFTFGDPFYALFLIFAYLFFLGKFYLLLASLVTGRVLEKKAFPRGSAKRLIRLFFHPFRVVAPLVITGLFFTLLLSNANYALRFATKDMVLFRLDQTLFGSSPFLWLPTMFFHPFFMNLFRYAYFSLAFAMSGMFILFFLVSRENLFRKIVVSFLLSLILSFPLFYVFPCQDPSHYFVQNLRANTFPKDVQDLRDAYSPSPGARALIEKIDKSEEDTTQDNAVPISCFPSMHAIWGLFVVFFLARARKWSLALTLPWLILLLTGGLYVAQHYAVDYLVALPVAAASMLLAELLLRGEANTRKKIDKKDAEAL